MSILKKILEYLCVLLVSAFVFSYGPVAYLKIHQTLAKNDSSSPRLIPCWKASKAQAYDVIDLNFIPDHVDFYLQAPGEIPKTNPIVFCNIDEGFAKFFEKK